MNQITKPKILIVDDEADMLDYMESRLNRIIECEIEKVSSGVTAIEKMKANNYDMVILDIKMPDKSGMDVIREVKKAKALPFVFVVTAYSSPQIASEAIMEGARDYQAKPLDLKIFDFKIKQGLESLGKLIDKR